jgi:peptide/nickel transport system ATP-binding protein
MILKGDVPSASKPPGGCRFHTRCFYVFDRCRAEEPALRPIEAGQFAACHLHDLPAAQNPTAGDAGVLPGEPTRGDIGPP